MIPFNDPFWAYVEDMADGGSKCRFCGHRFGVRTSITRIKLHFAGLKGRGVAICGQVPKNVQEEAYQAIEGSNKKQKTVPSSSNNEAGSATSTSSQEQYNINADLIWDVERMLTEDLGTQQEVGDDGEPSNFPSAEAGFQIETRTTETSQPILRSIPPAGRPPVDGHETGKANIQTADIVGPTTGRSWAEILALSNSDALQPLSRNLASLEFASSRAEVGSEIKEWESRLLLIHAVLDDAEEKQVTNKAVKIWLSKLRDFAYEVEDTLDDFQTESSWFKLRTAESQASTSAEGEHLLTSTSELQSDLKKITARLDDLVKEKNLLDLSTDAREMSNKVYNRVPTTSLLPKVYGREEDMEAILTLLRHDEPSDLPYTVIPITGMGGVGKTTLAQLIYNCDGLEFDCRAWIYVSDDFDVVKVTKTIIKHFGRCVEDDLNLLQVELMKKLSGKKFLIILDDVWNENYDLWTAFCSPFAAGAHGSKIIVTTQSTRVSSTMSSIPPYTLNGLSKDACLCLFARHALNAESFSAYPDLKDVGEKIIERCKGLPLATKILGGLLRGKQSVEEWEVMLNSKIWDLSENKSNILPALRLSYNYLPSHLKQCFAYCAIFPKGYKFDENELVLLWMAEGFLQKSKGLKQPQDLGLEYFIDLLSRSFFQQSCDSKSGYVMHDLIHDLAQSISEDICFHLDDKKSTGAELFAKVRHLSFTPHIYDAFQRFDVLNEMKGLRTFLALPISPMHGWNYLCTKVLDDLLPTLKHLRVLLLAGYGSLVKLPCSINALKHLRYLDLSRTAIERLPESLGELLNLQTLKLCGCEKLMELPAWIGKLINLRYLDIMGATSLREMPLEIGKLKNLHFLPRFIVGEGSGAGIAELRWLPHLQRQLCITSLDNITNVHDAKLANLKEKQGLGDLALEWSKNFHHARNESLEMQVLNSLKPHRSLKKFSIISYGGAEFPSWVGDPSFTKMVDLQLRNCPKVTSLQSLGELPSLRHLRMEGMNKLKEMVAEDFPSLENLYMKDMLELELWSTGVDGGAIGKFPKLSKLVLINCPVLIGQLPSSLTSLQKLYIYLCPKLTGLPEALPSLGNLVVEDCDQVIFRNVQNFNSLTSLSISGISGLEGLHEALVQALVGIQSLRISRCNQLNYLWEDGVGLEKLANLKQLDISDCEQLVSLVEGEEGYLPCNLQVLSLTECGNLQKLPSGLFSSSLLKELEICGCKKLVSFPGGSGFPYNLRSLKIERCSSLESLPDGMMTVMNVGNNSNCCILEELDIKDCPSLKSFPRGKLPTTLKKLRIDGCEEIEPQFSFLGGILVRDGKEMSNLEELSVMKFSITSFPAGKFPTSLKTLVIMGFEGIKSLPSLLNLSHLTELWIYYCNELVSFGDEELPLPNLVSLKIGHCSKLRSLPNHMDSLQTIEIRSCYELVSLGDEELTLPNLTSLSIRFCLRLRSLPNHMDSLRKLDLNYCWSLESFPKTGLPPKLNELEMGSCKNHRQPISEWRLHTLTSLKKLYIDFCYDTTPSVDCCFPDNDGLLLPNSLTELSISSYKNLKSISSGIQHLTSLEELTIICCPSLHILPEEGFPPSLQCLQIWDCPLLKEGSLKEAGDYWHIIHYIPQVKIDFHDRPFLKPERILHY